MNFFAISMILMALIACSMAFPHVEEHEVEERADRQRRLTCAGVSVENCNTACASVCRSTGKAGGSCSGCICLCRTTNDRDLWRQRFGA